MAKEDQAPDIKLLQQEVIEQRQLINQLLAERTAPAQPIQANIVMPDLEQERKAKFDRRTAEQEAAEAKSHAELMRGQRHFRVCIFDELALKALTNLKNKQPNAHVTDCTFPPQNPWRIVGAEDETHAIAKYNKFFGILGIDQSSKYMIYEVDQHGQQLASAPVAA